MPRFQVLIRSTKKHAQHTHHTGKLSVLCNCHRVDGRSRRDAANLHQEKVQKFLAEGYQRHLKLDSSGVRRVVFFCFELLGFAVDSKHRQLELKRIVMVCVII